MVESVRELEISSVPKRTGYEELDVAIDRIVRGEDPEHPNYGLGSGGNLYLDWGFSYKTKEGDPRFSVSVVLDDGPRGQSENALSYILNLRFVDRSVIVGQAKWIPKEI